MLSAKQSPCGIKMELEEKELKSQRMKRYEERFQIFVAISILLIVLESLMSERKKRGRVA